MHSQWTIRTLLVIWATSLSVVGACLMVGHWIPLPRVEINRHQVANLTTVSNSQSLPHWSVSHFLFAQCGCSKRVLDQLITLAPRDDVRERLFVVGSSAEWVSRARQRGFEVHQVTADQLKAQYGVEAVPSLVVIDPEGQIRYAGGYTSRKQGFDIQYPQILTPLMAGEEVVALPVYGCAVSRDLRSIVDPLGLKTP